MRILTVLTYYRPHTSGLTIYAERLARAFVRRGHQVTVMTTQYDKSLPREEIMDGVRIIRVPVAVRISKGVLAPTFGLGLNQAGVGERCGPLAPAAVRCAGGGLACPSFWQAGHPDLSL